jgi:outer membrane protein TolC
MLARRTAGALLSLLAVASPIAAQGTVTAPRQLSLAQALELAKQNSPTYRQAGTTAAPAAEAVKQANWARLPTLTVGTGMGYTGSGSQTFGGEVFASSAIVQSNYGFNAAVQLSTRVFLTPEILRAQEASTLQSIAAAGVSLTSNVTAAYLNVLLAASTVDVAREQITADTAFLALARLKEQVGQNTRLDVLQARTTLATAQTQLIQAQQAATQARINLVQVIGLPADANVDALTLTAPFALTEPKFDLATLLDMAKSSNPSVHALEEQDRANQLSLKAAHLDRLPTLSLSAGLSGYTQQVTNTNSLIAGQLQSAQAAEANCAFQNEIIMGLTTPIPGALIADCKAYAGLDATGNALQASTVQRIQASNSVFPFNFTRNPLSLSLNIQLPIWDAYSRSLRISQAEAARDAGQEQVRSQRLMTDAQIQTQLLAVRTAWSVIAIQDTNRATAREQLNLATQKYQVGNGTALDVATAQVAVTQAEAAYVTAVFDYHLAVVALEAAVGRPLR